MSISSRAAVPVLGMGGSYIDGGRCDRMELMNLHGGFVVGLSSIGCLAFVANRGAKGLNKYDNV